SLFFYQAEDGIRARNVTGVQTCALPILQALDAERIGSGAAADRDVEPHQRGVGRRLDDDGHSSSSWSGSGSAITIVRRAGSKKEIGRESCREGVVAGGWCW